MTDGALALQKEASQLAQQLFGGDTKKSESLTSRLLDFYTMATDKDFLLIHNPGGWGTARLQNCLQWERSIVTGVSTTIERLGYSWVLTQYFRSGHGWRERIRDTREQARFFTNKAMIMAAELTLVIKHLSRLRIILIGASQGAAFGNAVMLSLDGPQRVYSIELGIPFFHRSRRVFSERMIALDNNGLMPDALMEWDIPTVAKTYLAAPFRWIKYRIVGRPMKFTRCINVPGHDYNWEYPEVQRQVEEFLETNFNNKK